MRISKTEVLKATPGSKPYFEWDVEIRGFGLLILPSGVKSFVFQYRTPEGRTRRATIGKYSDTMTADQARARAKCWRIMVDGGGDPLGQKQDAREALTVAEVLDLYLASAKYAEKATATQGNDRGRIERHLKPTMGKKFIKKLTPEDVRKAFAAIRDGKTATDIKTGPRGRAIVRGGEGAARMAIRVFRAAINWAISEGITSENPAASVDIGSDDTRDTVLEKSADYARLFRTIGKMEHEKRLRPQVADAIRIIALTGARRGEIAGLRWSWVDLNKGVLILPPNAHKTGKRTKKPRIIGLPAAAQAIIAKQDKGKPNDFVFTPAKGDGAISLANPWRLIRAEAGLPTTIGLHGLRHSLATSMAMNGAEAAEIMAAMGHRQLSTAQKYIHWAQDGRAALAEKSAAHISGALAGNKKKAKVVQIKKGGRK